MTSANRDQPPIRELSDRIRARRAELGLTQERLAEAAGLHRTQVGGMECADKEPRLLTLMKLAHGLEMDLADLVRDLPPPDPF